LLQLTHTLEMSLRQLEAKVDRLAARTGELEIRNDD
jgi:hypothetical protein